MDLYKISLVHKLVLGDVLHASGRRDILETHQKGTNLIDDALKTLQDATLSTLIDTSLSLVENLKLLLESFKEYASRLV